MSKQHPPVLSFDNLIFADGRAIGLPPAGVVIFIGPNNAGKTTALRELECYLTQRKFLHNGRLNSVFQGATLRKVADDAFVKWAESFLDVVPPDPIQNPTMQRYRNWSSTFNAYPQRLTELFHSDGPLAELASLVICNGLPAAYNGSTPNFYEPSNGGNRQYDELMLSRALQESLKRLSMEAFGVPVSVSTAGSQSHLHYGDLPSFDDPPTEEQQECLRIAPRVIQQGEGVKALISLGQTLMLGKEPLMFLDEPEAHLHPPQAKLAGKYIAQRGQRSQIFITTHSIDLLIGLTSTPNTAITIVRLNRPESGQTTFSVLSDEDLTVAWQDPVIRYSRALYGLVHKGVVVCESDADCLYYEAALDYLREAEGVPSHDLLFVHAGGNAGAKKIVTALKKLSVPLNVLVDFDTLREWEKLKSLFEALGGDEKAIWPLWRDVDNCLRSKGETRTISEVSAEITSVLAAMRGADLYGKKAGDAIRKKLASKSGWDEAKEHGLDAIKGVPRRQAESLLSELESFGLVVCPFGELEAFHREIPGIPHGPEWAIKAVEGKLYKKLDVVHRKFVADIPNKLV